MVPFPPYLLELGAAPNIMREISAYGRRRAAVVGEENVLDFSLGNPSVPAPPQVAETIRALAEGPNGYTPAGGDPEMRALLAEKLTTRFGTPLTAEDLWFTMGATGALCMCFQALSGAHSEIVLPAPFFTEYTVFAAGNGCTPVVVPALEPDFGLNLPGMEQAVGPNTRAVVVDLPNNPSGAVYTPEETEALAALLRRKEKEYGHPIYLISDEPYRELVFDGAKVPWFPDCYDDSIVCYSYSKALALPGQRIGYLLVNPAAADREDLWSALRGAARILGYISAPGMFQRVATLCEGLTADISIYQRNRDLLYNGLTAMGYSCPKPMGTFYLLLKTPEGDGEAFSRRAMAKDLLVAPGEPFYAPGYVRVAFCCPSERIERALPIFRQLLEETK